MNNNPLNALGCGLFRVTARVWMLINVDRTENRRTSLALCLTSRPKSRSSSLVRFFPKYVSLACAASNVATGQSVREDPSFTISPFTDTYRSRSTAGCSSTDETAPIEAPCSCYSSECLLSCPVQSIKLYFQSLFVEVFGKL